VPDCQRNVTYMCMAFKAACALPRPKMNRYMAMITLCLRNGIRSTCHLFRYPRHLSLLLHRNRGPELSDAAQNHQHGDHKVHASTVVIAIRQRKSSRHLLSPAVARLGMVMVLTRPPRNPSSLRGRWVGGYQTLYPK
jgi:hypothetical protein